MLPHVFQQHLVVSFAFDVRVFPLDQLTDVFQLFAAVEAVDRSAEAAVAVLSVLTRAFICSWTSSIWWSLWFSKYFISITFVLSSPFRTYIGCIFRTAGTCRIANEKSFWTFRKSREFVWFSCRNVRWYR
jgi:hypothetical protein